MGRRSGGGPRGLGRLLQAPQPAHRRVRGIESSVLAALAAAAAISAAACGPAASSEAVRLLRLPEGGRLPRAVIDAAGALHVVYVTGEPRAGDLAYVTRAPGDAGWSAPRRVNSRPGTVAGLGPIDGGQIALGPDGRLHVVWFTMNPAEFLYTRTRAAGGGFEPQLALAAGEGVVEAGPAVAADRTGNVYVFWHTGDGAAAERAVFMTVSHDGGRIFTPARPVNAPDAGACECCALHALADPAGAVHVSYRGAGGNVRRGQRLLTSLDQGATFTDDPIDPWDLNACPIATTSLTPGPDGLAVAWETAGQVHVAPVDAPARRASPAGAAEFRRKNPAAAVNHRGETLLAWGDGPGWRSGGTLHWQLFDAAGAPTDDRGAGPELPDGSLAAVAAEPDGRFVMIF